MANHYTDTEEREMDLQDLFDLFKRGFYSFVKVVFKAIDFFLKFWWIIIVLGAIGYALGYLSKDVKEYSATLIIKTNYDSQAYVYNAVEQFNDRLSGDNNSDFLKEIGLDIENPEITEVTITPIIDVVELLSKVPNDRTMTAVIKEIELEEDESIFASEEFYSNFNYHKLVVSAISPNSQKVVEAMIAYMNSQPQIQRIAEMTKANFIERVAINETSLKQIDDVIKIYTETVDFANKTANKTGFYNNENSLSIRELFDTKKELTEETEELKNELATMEGSIYVVSDSQFKKEGSFLSSSSFKYMAILIFGFLLFAFFRYCYLTLRSGLAQMEATKN